MAKMVFSGLVMLWRLAGCPTSTSPESLNATTEGVVRAPSAFSITLALLPSITATQELVVPRSIPIALAMMELLAQFGSDAGFRSRSAPLAPACGPSGGRGRAQSGDRARAVYVAFSGGF